MAYITEQQMIERFGEASLVKLTDRQVPAAGVMDSDTLARALADTDAEIDAWLAGRYALPLDTIPPLLTSIAGDIAYYKLHRAQAPDKVRDDYGNALKRLEALSKGTMKLAVAGVEVEAGSNAGGIVTNTGSRPMTMETLKGYI